MDLRGLRNQMKDVSGRLPGKETPIMNATVMERAGSTARGPQGGKRDHGSVPG